tara:strand:- start:18432 stop:19076 length:645 start_codon:yes stop_codon:yes gene_type:complete
MKKIFIITLTFFTILLSGNLYAKYPYKIYTYEDIKRIKDSSKKDFFFLCKKKKPNNISRCYLDRRIKFFKYLNIYDGNGLGGHKILDYCLNSNRANFIQFNGFYSCIDDLKRYLNAKTPFPEINHFLIIPEEISYLVSDFCYKKHPYYKLNDRNRCLNEQKMYFGDFKQFFFRFKENTAEYKKLESCMPDFYSISKDGENLLINFKGIMECMKQ